jgi:hypothetical protein
MPLLKLESGAYLAGLQHEKRLELISSLRPYLESSALGHSGFTSTQVQQLLQAVSNENGPFKGLSGAYKDNLSMAIKQAFRHSTGVTVDLNLLDALQAEIAKNKSLPAGQQRKALHSWLERMAKAPQNEAASPLLWQLQGDFTHLGAEEQSQFLSRLSRLSQVDALDQANTILRRGLNVARPHVGSTELLARTEAMADWIDKAVAQRLTLDEMAVQELDAIHDALEKVNLPPAVKDKLTSLKSLHQLETALTELNDRRLTKPLAKLKALNAVLGDKAGKSLGEIMRGQAGKLMRALVQDANAGKGISAEEKVLLTKYQALFEEAIDTRTGRLFSMLLLDSPEAREAMAWKLREVISGGLQNDSAFVRKDQVFIVMLSTVLILIL